MELASQKIDSITLFNLLEEFFKHNSKKLNNEFSKQSDEMVEKLYDHAKELIINTHIITFGTKAAEGNWTELRYNSIISIRNIRMAYIVYLCLKDISNKKFSITILKTKYDKEVFEFEEYFNVVSTLFMYNVNDTSKALSINKIDDILSINTKNIKYAKNIRNSITTRLTSRKDDNYFRPHPKTINQIVPIEKLGKYLDLADKYTYIECPICGKNIKIEKTNIKQIFEFKNSDIRIICSHELTIYQRELPFSLEVSKYIENSNTKNLNVQMFVLNNFDKLVKKFSIHPNLRKITKKSNQLYMHELEDYLYIGDQYIFVDFHIGNSSENDMKKIKITNENLMEIFNVNLENKKVYINIPTDREMSSSCKIVYVDLLNLIRDDDLNESLNNKHVALTLVHNYKLLHFKKLITRVN